MKRTPVRVMMPDEVKAFLEAIKGQRFEALFTVAISMGLRQGELLGLRWSDLDLGASVLHVRYAMQRVNGKPTLTEPKTERSRRTLHTPQVAVKAFRSQRVQQSKERLLAGANWQDLDFVFATSIGTPVDARNLIRHFERALIRAKLLLTKEERKAKREEAERAGEPYHEPPRLHFHSLRHSCASLLLIQKVPARTVMELLGHSEIRLTMDTYSHVMPQLMTEAANAMDDALGNGKP